MEFQDVKIGEFANVLSGYAFKSKEFTENGIPIIKIKNIRVGSIDLDDVQFVDESYLDLDQKFHVRKGDLLISLTGSHLTQPNSVVGRVARYSGPHALLNQRAGKIIFEDENICNRKFLYYLLSTLEYKRKLALFASGAASQANISPSQVESLEVKLPDFQTQEKIASILSAFDDLISTNTRRIEILEEMARRIYREWFVHFRYPGHENDELVDSGTDEFDAVPERWDLKVMDEILGYYIGGTWGQEEPEDEEKNPAYVIRGTDIPGARAGNVDEVPLRYHKQSYINSRKLQDGDIVFEVSGGSKDQPVGRAMLITNTFLSELDCDDVLHASFCKLLRPEKSILKPEILYLHIREIYDDRRIMKYQVQSTGISNFKFTFFAENKLMFVPPIKLQEKFQEIVRPLFKQMYMLGKKNNRLKEMRDLLLPKLISGKIEV